MKTTLFGGIRLVMCTSLSALLILQSGCGGDAPSTKPDPVPGPQTPGVPAAPRTTAVTPTLAASRTGEVTTFRIVDNLGAPASAATWRVNNVVGGSAQLGIISSAGVYTAPATIPEGDSVVVSALVDGEATPPATSTLFFVPALNHRSYYVVIPRVFDITHPGSTRILVVPPSDGTSVTFLPRSGAPVPLAPIGAGVFTFSLNAAAEIAGYETGTLHSYVGRLDYRTASGVGDQVGVLSVNVRDAGMPDVAIVPLAPDAQRSAYVLNIRVDAAPLDPTGPMVARALELLGDNFDFMVFLSTVTNNVNRSYAPIRNSVRGVGLALFDSSAKWGITPGGRLRGLINYPLDGAFDGAEYALTHEIGHAWVNFATDAVLGPTTAHWPPSTMALGVMGFSIPGSRGGDFPWAITSLGNGTARINAATPTRLFSSLDLYAMGLIPPDSVPPMMVLPQGTLPSSLSDGMIMPATTYTIDDYIATVGERVPSSATAPRQFAAACVVPTYGRLMSATEMAFFEAACKRAESKTPLISVMGLAPPTAMPGFYLATGGRATLTTRLPN